ncbi:MAG: response regulator transcription factor [Myxococcota bacterium]|jgi:two-component system OmpR family response regulator|nr:response regulator transcription factor [Myxococcota bacterium]
MSDRKTILVVDDDAHIREVVRFALRKAGFDVIESADGRDALDTAAREHPDLVVLDILMPEMDGTDVCCELRKRSRTPIVFLSSKDDEIDRIIGLELGGDDYVTKPFSPRELVARVRAVLRRTDMMPPGAPDDGEEQAGQQLVHGKLRLDLDRFRAFWADEEVVLTVTEFGILRTLLGYPGKVFSRTELMDGAYRDYTVVAERTIDSHVRRVRHKFGAVDGDPVETVHGVGYRLTPCE